MFDIFAAACDFYSFVLKSTNFLEEDSNLWQNLSSFVAAQKTAAKLRATNDTAERGVAPVQEYNGPRKKSEEQTQFIRQVVAEHQKKPLLITKTALVEAQTKAK